MSIKTNEKFHKPLLINPTSVQERTQREKEEAVRIALIAALMEVMGDVSEETPAAAGAPTAAAGAPTRGVVKEATTTANQVPVNQDLVDCMVKMAQALGMLQVNLAKYGEDRLQMSYKIGQLNVEIAQKALAKIRETLDEIQKSRESAKAWDIAAKVFGGIVTAIVCVVAISTGQFYLAAMALTMYALSVSGQMDKITGEDGALTKWVEETFGVSKQEAMLISSAIVVVATIVLTAGASAGVNLAARGSAMFGQAVKAAIFAGTQAMSISGFVNNASASIAESIAKDDEEKKRDLQIFFSVLLNVIVAALGAGVGYSLANGAPLKLLSQNKLSLLVKLGSAFQGVGGVAEGSAQIGIGSALTRQGSLEKELGKHQADQTLANMNLSVNNKERAADMEALMQQLKAIAEQTAMGEAVWAKGWQALAEILAHSAA